MSNEVYLIQSRWRCNNNRLVASKNKKQDFKNYSVVLTIKPFELFSSAIRMLYNNIEKKLLQAIIYDITKN
jgi:hypothetical protein